MNQPQPASRDNRFNPYAITGPAPVLMRYYALTSLLAGPFFWVVLLPLYFRYHTLRYRFDDKGVSMSWGILWKHETLLTYRRIQDIHLTRNIVQRWLGLATVAIQTASGSASAEMSIEGILEAEPLRDFLYAKMRGARGLDEPASPAVDELEQRSEPAADDEALQLLREIRDALARLTRRQEANR